MIETLVLSVYTVVLFIAGVVVGMLSVMNDTVNKANPNKDSKTHTMMKLNGGKWLQMWKGFVDPSYTFVSTGIDGDSVVFDKDGNIIYVEKHAEKG